MKNKKLAYILLPAVIGIWAIIFYRIFSAAGGDAVNTDNAVYQNMNKQDHAGSDNFDLLGEYRDPFLGKTASLNDKPKQHNAPSLTPTKKEEAKQAAQAWPAVSYAGMIKNQHSSAQLALIKINGKSYTMKPGESTQNIKLLKVFRDSVELSFEGDKRTIKK